MTIIRPIFQAHNKTAFVYRKATYGTVLFRLIILCRIQAIYTLILDPGSCKLWLRAHCKLHSCAQQYSYTTQNLLKCCPTTVANLNVTEFCKLILNTNTVLHRHNFSNNCKARIANSIKFKLASQNYIHKKLRLTFFVYICYTLTALALD